MCFLPIKSWTGDICQIHDQAYVYSWHGSYSSWWVKPDGLWEVDDLLKSCSVMTVTLVHHFQLQLVSSHYRLYPINFWLTQWNRLNVRTWKHIGFAVWMVILAYVISQVDANFHNKLWLVFLHRNSDKKWSVILGKNL